MPAPYSRARLDRALRTRGEDALLRRRVGTSNVYAEILVRITFRGYRAQELSGGIIQGDSVAVMSPTALLNAQPAVWPGAATGTLIPRAQDNLIVQGRTRNVQAVATIYEFGEPVRIELQCRG